VRFGSLASVGAWVSLLAALGSSCGGGNDKTFEGEGYSFSYPGGWEQREGSGAAAEVGNAVSSVAFAPAQGANGLTVTVYRLQVVVTEENVDSLRAEVAAVTEQIFREAGGRVTAGPNRVTIAGHPGFSAKGTGMTPAGNRVESQVTLIFDGKSEYFLNCQFTADQAEEIQQGCRKVLESLEFG
jgi:hypothetical protein